MCFVLLVLCARYTTTVLQIRIEHPDVARKGISGMMLIALSQFNATVINFDDFYNRVIAAGQYHITDSR